MQNFVKDDYGITTKLTASNNSIDNQHKLVNYAWLGLAMKGKEVAQSNYQPAFVAIDAINWLIEVLCENLFANLGPHLAVGLNCLALSLRLARHGECLIGNCLMSFTVVAVAPGETAVQKR